MKTQISPFQLTILLANFTFAGTLISLPQKLVDVSGQNTWFVPLMVLPILLIIFGLGLAKITAKLESYLEKAKGSYSIKVFAFLLSIFLLFTFVRDLRATTDFVGTVLLPTTPIPIITLLSVFTLMYISVGGIEVVARLTQIQFVLFGGTIVLLPILLLNRIEWTNFQPILGASALPTLFQSSYLLIPWIGEMVIVFLLLGSVRPIKQSRKAILWSIMISVCLLFILILLEIAVLGGEIVRFSSYPNYQLIQEISITDFLDRLDLIIVTLWVPTIFCKMALSLFCLYKSLNILKGSESKTIVLPVTIFLGLLSILLFKNNMMHLEFSFYTWATLGLFLEILIFCCYFLVRRSLNNKKKNSKAIQDSQ